MFKIFIDGFLFLGFVNFCKNGIKGEGGSVVFLGFEERELINLIKFLFDLIDMN